MRPEPLTRLMESVLRQSVKPDEVLIIDGSIDNLTELRFRESEIKNLHYYKVSNHHRGLTKQRNQKFPDAVGIGGYITNEVHWEETNENDSDDLQHFYYDGYRRKESSRYRLRRKLGLAQKTPPAVYPEFGHGRSISFLPPSGKIYEVEQLMGGVCRKT